MANLFELSATLGLDTSEFVESINSARTTARQAQQELQQAFNQTSTETERSANTAASALQNLFSFSGAQLLTSAIQTAGSALKAFATESISAASDLVEVQNVVDVTFGSSCRTSGGTGCRPCQRPSIRAFPPPAFPTSATTGRRQWTHGYPAY